MAGYCGRCNQHYECHYTVHDEECPGFEETKREHLLPEELDAIERGDAFLEDGQFGIYIDNQ